MVRIWYSIGVMFSIWFGIGFVLGNRFTVLGLSGYHAGLGSVTGGHDIGLALQLGLVSAEFSLNKYSEFRSLS